MVKEAEKYAAEDKKKKEEVETINQANASVFSTEKSLKDYGDKVSDDDKKAIESELENLKKAIESKDLEKIKGAQEALTKASHKLAEEVYKSTAAQQTAGAGAAAQDTGASAQADAQPEAQEGKASSDAKKEDVIDADFKVEDEK